MASESTTVGLLGCLGGVFTTAAGFVAWLKIRAKTADRRQRLDERREVTTIEALNRRVDSLEAELRDLRRELRITRRVGHDISEISNATRMALVSKVFEINQILLDHDKPARYPDPVGETMRIINAIGQSVIGERAALYEKASAEVMRDQTAVDQARREV